jgi:hypothetical protein
MLTNILLTKKSSLIFVLAFLTVAILDSILPKLYSFSGSEPSSPINVATYTFFLIAFGITSITLLISVGKIIPKYESRFSLSLGSYSVIVLGTVTLSLVIMVLIAFQMVYLQQYSADLLRFQTYLSRLSPLVFMVPLVYSFFNWLRVRKNTLIVLYTISFAIVCANLLISLYYLDLNFASSPSSVIRPSSIVSYVANLGGTTLTQSLSSAFDILSLVAFLLIWIATVKLLSQFRYRMGTLKFFVLMSIPLIYYIFPFQGYYGDVFFTLLVSSPVIFTIIYILIFSATKQVGAFFFGLTFWSASSLVYDELLRKSLLVSFIGMTIIFASVELAPLQFRIYPPYGLVTEAYIPVGAYLLFVGIFTSAVRISRNAELRKVFYRNVSAQLDLFKNIGVSQMEKELEERVNSLQKVSEPSLVPFEPEELDSENAKRILREVIEELHSGKEQHEKRKKRSEGTY